MAWGDIVTRDILLQEVRLAALRRPPRERIRVTKRLFFFIDDSTGKNCRDRGIFPDLQGAQSPATPRCRGGIAGRGRRGTAGFGEPGGVGVENSAVEELVSRGNIGLKPTDVVSNLNTNISSDTD